MIVACNIDSAPEADKLVCLSAELLVHIFNTHTLGTHFVLASDLEATKLTKVPRENFTNYFSANQRI